MTDNPIVARLWAQCDILRDDGINYSDYVTELVLLLFLKMEHELKEEDGLLPEDARWGRLLGLDGMELRDTYQDMLLRLSRSKEKRIAAIYADAQSRIREPRHLKASPTWMAFSGSTRVAMDWATCTRACWRRTLPKPRVAPASTSPPVRSLKPSST